MLDSLKEYFEERRTFNAVEKAFGEMLARRSGLEMTMEGIALYLLGAAALSAVEGSHSCLDLQEWCREEIADLKQLNAEKKEQTDVVSPEELEHWLDEWQSICRELPEKASKAIIRCSYGESLNDVSVPLVIVESNETMVYLNRYFSYEKTIGEQIRERIKPMGQGESEQQSDVDVSDLQSQVHISTTFFAEKALAEDNQQLAVLNSLQSPFSIVTGGPGRGKTTVLATILALALKMTPGPKESWPEIALCAPTGKAAARMKQAIDKAVRNDLSKDVFDEQILTFLSELRPWTVHRLLGLHQNSDYPTATAKNRLPYDFVAVDE